MVADVVTVVVAVPDVVAAAPVDVVADDVPDDVPDDVDVVVCPDACARRSSASLAPSIFAVDGIVT